MCCAEGAPCGHATQIELQIFYWTQYIALMLDESVCCASSGQRVWAGGGGGRSLVRVAVAALSPCRLPLVSARSASCAHLSAAAPREIDLSIFNDNRIAHKLTNRTRMQFHMDMDSHAHRYTTAAKEQIINLVQRDDITISKTL